jgi:hypothetical protein
MALPHRVFVKTFLYLLLIYSSALSQILVDVKTRLNEKKELHFIKIAVISAVDSSKHFRTTEVGEKFSVWLTHFKRTTIGDSVRSEFNLEFHTPAMFSEGRFLQAKHLKILFDSTGLSAQISSSDTALSKLVVQYLVTTKILNKFLQFLGVSSPLLSTNPILASVIELFISKFFKKFNRRPSAFEAVEASLLATKATFEIERFARRRYPTRFRDEQFKSLKK